MIRCLCGQERVEPCGGNCVDIGTRPRLTYECERCGNRTAEFHKCPESPNPIDTLHR